MGGKERLSLALMLKTLLEKVLQQVQKYIKTKNKSEKGEGMKALGQRFCQFIQLQPS